MKLFCIGENRWRDEPEWPLSRAVATRYYLSSGGSANTASGDGVLSPISAGDDPKHHYTYDYGRTDAQHQEVIPVVRMPRAPWALMISGLSSAGRTRCVTPALRLTMTLRSRGPSRSSFGPLLQPWIRIGSPVWSMSIRTAGRSIWREEIIRASYREGHKSRLLLERDRAYEYRIDLRATSVLFAAGHKIRLHIGSSSFPMWDANPNTGASSAEADVGDLVIASQTIFMTNGAIHTLFSRSSRDDLLVPCASRWFGVFRQGASLQTSCAGNSPRCRPCHRRLTCHYRSGHSVLRPAVESLGSSSTQRRHGS